MGTKIIKSGVYKIENTETGKVYIGSSKDLDKLLELEQKWLDFYKSYDRDKGYNTLPIAGSSRGFNCSEETKNKIAKANTGKIRPNEVKKKMSEAQKGKTLSEDTRWLLTIRNREKANDPLMRKKWSESKMQEWIITSPEGEIFKVIGLLPFCKENRLSYDSLRAVAKNHKNKKHYKGWKCKKAGEE